MLVMVKSLFFLNSRPLGLRANFIWNLTGNLVYSFCQWGILILLAKLTTPEMVGRFALGLAVTAPIVLFSQLHLRGVQATDAKGEYDFCHYLALRLLTSGLAMAFIVAFITWGDYDLKKRLVILAIGGAKIFESIADVFYGLMQRHERMDRIARSRIIKGVATLVIVGGVVWISKNVFVGVLAMAATWAVILVTYDVKNARRTLAEVRIGEGGDPASSRRLAPLFDSSLLARLAWLALPMGGVMALISLRSNLPRYFIEKCWGEATLGIFAAIAYLIFAGDTLVVAMGQSVVSRLSVHYANGNMRQYKRVLLSLVGIAGGVGIVGIAAAAFAGPFILSLLYRPEYVVQTKVFTGLMIVGALMYLSSSLSQGVMAARCFKILFPIVLVSTALTAGGSWLWIPKYGLLGAVGALALGGVAQLLGNAGGVLYALRSKSREIPTHVP